MNRPISVMHVVAGLHPKSGGPSRTVPGLVDALAGNANLNLSLYSQGLKSDPFIAPEATAVDFRLAVTESRLQLGLGFPVRTQLSKISKGQMPSIVHGHGIWHPVNHWAANFAKSNSIPYIVHPRGMLEGWSMAHHALRKKFAMALYQRCDLQSASLLLATSEPEYASIRQMKLTMPVAVIPNGVDIPMPGSISSGIDYVNADRTRRMLFLSRIHPKKGLFNLLDAWKIADIKGWILEIAGPDEAGHLQEVRNRIKELGLSASVRYIGEKSGDEKSAAYQCTDLFVLPTFSENFGMVIAEALSYGIPVITTNGTPWAEIEENGCGWWIDIGVEPLVAALQQATALSDEQRLQMGSKGREYVQRYNWRDIAGQMMQAYQWVLGQGSKPDFVRLD